MSNLLIKCGILSVACAVGQPLTALAGDSSDPNILFILIDDLGIKDLGCYGSTMSETPVIDKLASEIV